VDPVTGAIGAIFTFLGIVLTVIGQRYKTRLDKLKATAEAEKIVSETDKLREEVSVMHAELEKTRIHISTETISDLRQELTAIRVEVKELREANRTLTRENDRLTTEVQSLTRIVAEAVGGLRLQRVLENVSDAVLIESPARQVAQVNPAFCELFGIPTPARELQGEDCAKSIYEQAFSLTETPGFIAGVSQRVADWVDVYDERIAINDSTPVYRTFLALTHSDGSREAAWIYRRA